MLLSTSAIASGETKTGSISGGEVDTYTFEAKAGSSVVVAAGDNPAPSYNDSDPEVTLYGPDGTRVAGSWGYTGTVAYAESLRLSGTYTLEVTDHGADNQGSYKLSLAKLPGPQASDPDGGSIASGVKRAGTVGAGDLDILTFSAVAGDVITFGVGEVVPSFNDSDPAIDLYSPAGAPMADAWGYTGASVSGRVAPLSGTYYAVVTDHGGDNVNSRCNYSLSLTPASKSTISIAATDATSAEPGTDTGTFTVARTNVRATPLTVNYTISGTATNGTDYNAIAGSVTIPANASSATIRVTPKADTAKESTESVVLTLGSNSAYNIDSTKRAATVGIADSNIGVALSIAATDGTASESAVGPTSSGAFTLSRSKATTAPLVVSLGIGGSATLNGDYRLLVYGATASLNTTTKTLTLTIALGTGPVRIIVEVLNDSANESAEQVTLSLKTGTGYVVNSAKAGATVSIADRSAV